MKKSLIIIFAACALSSACTPDGVNTGDGARAVKFVMNAYEAGHQYAGVLSVDKPVAVSMEAVFSEVADVSGVRLSVDQDYIHEYNEISGESLMPLPAWLYTVVDEAVSVENDKAEFNVLLHGGKIAEYAQAHRLTAGDMENYAVAVRLVAPGHEIDTADGVSLGHFVLVPRLVGAYVQLDVERLDSRSYEITVSTPFENDSFNISWEIDFGREGYTQLSQFRGNRYPARYRCSSLPQSVMIEGEDVTSMAPGIGRVAYKVTFPEDMQWQKGETFNYMFSIRNVMADGHVPLEVRGNDALICLDSSHYNEVTSSGRAGEKYSGGFNAAELALLGTTLNELGLKAYMDDSQWYWHPQSSCQYDGRDMCENGLFDHASLDWAVAYNSNGYGYDALKDGITWGVVDMGRVMPVEGMEFWRKAEKAGTPGTACEAVRTFEFYAVDNCIYKKLQPFLSYNQEELTYLGRASFSDSDYTQNILSATFDSARTQYLLVLFLDGHQAGYHCVEMKLFH